MSNIDSNNTLINKNIKLNKEIKKEKEYSKYTYIKYENTLDKVGYLFYVYNRSIEYKVASNSELLKYIELLYEYALYYKTKFDSVFGKLKLHQQSIVECKIYQSFFF